MKDFDREAARHLRRGNRYEDFEPGLVLNHHWGRTLNEGDNSLFSTTTMMFNPMYFNAEYARAHGHSSVVINPMLLLSTIVGLTVEDLSEGGGPFLGVNELTFHRAVYPGDTVYARSTVLSRRPSASRPRFGIVTWHTEGLNQRDELVIDFKRTNLVTRRRSAEAAAEPAEAPGEKP